MEILSGLINCKSSDELQSYIEVNYAFIADYLSLSKYSELNEEKDLFKQLSLKLSLFEDLDYGINENVALVNVILNASIRLGDRFIFNQFHKILIKNNLPVSKLIEASSYYMNDGRDFETLYGKIDLIHLKLEESYIEEEDDNKNVIAALLNYYQFFIEHFLEFASDKVVIVRLRLIEIKGLVIYSFNQAEVLDKILDFNPDFNYNPSDSINQIIDEFLSRKSFLLDTGFSFLLEAGTDYSVELGTPPFQIQSIILVNKRLYSAVASDSTFYSLQRGVKVLEDYNQLLCYMYALGNMHIAKLKEAISYIPFDIKSHRVIDWGCGQGLGSVVYLEELEERGQQNQCEKIILIEPSEIAIKRAALHIQGRTDKIITYNKDIDSVALGDLNRNTELITVHIFSNILDIDFFSLPDLINLIKHSCKGENYFVIVSPFENIIKLARIDSFVKSFTNEIGFKILHESAAKCGQWKSNWSKIIRVFKTEI